MEIEYPSEIRILGHHFTLQIGDFPDLEEQHVYGEVHYRNEGIRIIGNLSPCNTQETFLHEVLHVVARALVGKSLSEHNISMITLGLNEVLLDLGINFVKRGICET